MLLTMFSKPLMAAVLWPLLCVCSSCTVVPWGEDVIPAEFDSSAIPYSLGLSGKQHWMILLAVCCGGCHWEWQWLPGVVLPGSCPVPSAGIFTSWTVFHVASLAAVLFKKNQANEFLFIQLHSLAEWVHCGVWKKKLGRSYCSESSLYICSSGLAL